ncbi:MAG TPA: hypothetical protein VI451_16970 [Anaerolineales bacterium]|nr:hypothetical protein [Anaerolineales bacterium]
MKITRPFLLLLFLFTLMRPDFAAACDFFPIPFFLESFSFDRTDLPPDIEVNGTINDQVGFESWGVLEFVNQTDSALLPISGYGSKPIDFQSKNNTGQVRPKNITVPEPHTVILLLATNGEIHELPVSISYEINPDR